MASPATRTDCETAMPVMLMSATSLVPPPMSSTRLPRGSCTGMPAPMAAAMGSSTRETERAPDSRAASMTAFFSTWVMPVGMQITMDGLTRRRPEMHLPTKWAIISRVMSKSAMTPSFMGRMAQMFWGVRPRYSLAAAPTASTLRLTASTATTEGSLMKMPCFLVYSSVLAVPRSMAMSWVRNLLKNRDSMA